MLVDAYVRAYETPFIGYILQALITFGYVQRARDYLKQRGYQKFTVEQRIGLCFVDMICNTFVYNVLTQNSGMFERFTFVPFMLCFVVLFAYEGRKPSDFIEKCYKFLEMPLIMLDCCEKMTKIRGQYRWCYFVAQQTRPAWRFLLDNLLFSQRNDQTHENSESVIIGQQLSRFFITTTFYVKQFEDCLLIADIVNQLIGLFDIKQLNPYKTPFCWAINTLLSNFEQNDHKSSKNNTNSQYGSPRIQNSTPVTVESQMMNTIS